MIGPMAPLPGIAGPTGLSPMAQPSPNLGTEAVGISKVRQAISILQEAFGDTDPTSDLGQDILDTIKKLSRSAPPMQGAPGIGREALLNLVAQARQSAPLQAVMRSMAQGGAPGGAPGMMPPAPGMMASAPGGLPAISPEV